MTQKMTCKLPKHADHDMINPNTKGWIDFCPFKKTPRIPRFGAMGYSIRTLEWRYTAWLKFDTDTFLPSLNLPPLAEELYNHVNSNKINNRSDVNVKSFQFGFFENVNLANESTHVGIINGMRVKLYDYLWNNVSFEHLFQKRNHNQQMRAITQGRFHADAHPHRLKYSKHYFT